MNSSVFNKRFFSVGLLCCMVAGVLSVSSASADQFASQSAAAGSPAATATVVVTPPIYLYQGGQITEKQMTEKELVCLQTASDFRCYNSAAELEAAEASKSEVTAGGVHPDVECGGGISRLYTFNDKNYSGGGASLEARGAWYDFDAANNNQTSSFAMGVYSGHLSENSGGGGYWYPGNTGVCATEPNIATAYPSWNDTISSRYRN